MLDAYTGSRGKFVCQWTENPGCGWFWSEIAWDDGGFMP